MPELLRRKSSELLRKRRANDPCKEAALQAPGPYPARLQVLRPDPPLLGLHEPELHLCPPSGDGHAGVRRAGSRHAGREAVAEGAIEGGELRCPSSVRSQ